MSSPENSNDRDRLRKLSDFIRKETGIELLGPDDIVNNNININLKDDKNDKNGKNEKPIRSRSPSAKKQKLEKANTTGPDTTMPIYMNNNVLQAVESGMISIRDILLLHKEHAINDEGRNILLEKALKNVVEVSDSTKSLDIDGVKQMYMAGFLTKTDVIEWIISNLSEENENTIDELDEGFGDLPVDVINNILGTNNSNDVKIFLLEKLITELEGGVSKIKRYPDKKDILLLHEEGAINGKTKNDWLLRKAGELDFKTIVNLRKEGAISESKKRELLLQISNVTEKTNFENEKKDLDEVVITSEFDFEEAFRNVKHKKWGLMISDIVYAISSVTGADVEDLVSHPVLNKYKKEKKVFLQSLNYNNLKKLIESGDNANDKISNALNKIKNKYIFVNIGFTKEIKEIAEDKQAAEIQTPEQSLWDWFWSFLKSNGNGNNSPSLEQRHQAMIQKYKDNGLNIIDINDDRWDFSPEVNISITWAFNRINSIRSAIVGHNVLPIETNGNFTQKYSKSFPTFYQNVINLIAARLNVMDKLSGNNQDKFRTRYDKGVLLSEITNNLKAIELFFRYNPYI